MRLGPQIHVVVPPELWPPLTVSILANCLCMKTNQDILVYIHIHQTYHIVKSVFIQMTAPGKDIKPVMREIFQIIKLGSAVDILN